MRLLCFQAKRFWWKTFEKTLREAPDQEVEQEVREALVAFVHVEAADLGAEREASVFRQTLKHLKWLANKRALRAVVLHSFTHLGGDSAAPAAAAAVLERLRARLGETGYETHVTPFGYLNEWDLSVFGDSLAKVWKQI
jgi:Archaea-specific editing domain of threonyl-tRNA synthetase